MHCFHFFIYLLCFLFLAHENPIIWLLHIVGHIIYMASVDTWVVCTPGYVEDLQSLAMRKFSCTDFCIRK